MNKQTLNNVKVEISDIEGKNMHHDYQAQTFQVPCKLCGGHGTIPYTITEKELREAVARLDKHREEHHSPPMPELDDGPPKPAYPWPTGPENQDRADW